MVVCVLATASTFFVLTLLTGGRVAAVGALFVFSAGCVPVGLALARLLPATLRVEPEGVTLTRALGLRHRQVTFPLTVETGSLEDVRESGMVKDGNGYRGPWSTLRVGSYIGLVGANGMRITVGAKRNTRPLKYWTVRHRQGQSRRAGHIQLTPVRVVQMQYLLAVHDVFQPRSGTPAPGRGG
jgi:hypothetical protein